MRELPAERRDETNLAQVVQYLEGVLIELERAAERYDRGLGESPVAARFRRLAKSIGMT